MARARNLKPGFFKNEDLAECSPWARLAFAGSWTLADRDGRLEDRPKRIKGELFAYDSVEIEPLLDELEQHGFIDRYTVDSVRVIQIVNFAKHQTPHFKEVASSLPPRPDPISKQSAKNGKPEAFTSSNGVQTSDMPEAQMGLNDTKAQGKPEVSPRLDPPKVDLARGANPSDSLFSDSLFSDSPLSESIEKTSSPAQLPTGPACPQQRIRELYAEILPTLPRAKKWDNDRETALRARWRDQVKEKGWATVDEGIVWFRRFFEAVSENDWAMGRAGRSKGHENWECDIDYLLSVKGFRKIIESDGRAKVAA